MSFVKDGDQYMPLGGTSSSKWHPYMSGEKYTNVFNKGKWEKELILKKDETVHWKFRIGKQPVKISDWMSEKKNWPFLHIQMRHSSLYYNEGTNDYTPKLRCTTERVVIFTEGDMTFKTDKDVIAKMKKDWEKLQTALGEKLELSQPADSTMQTSQQSMSGKRKIEVILEGAEITETSRKILKQVFDTAKVAAEVVPLIL